MNISISDRKQGRRFGGKFWLVKSSLNVISFPNYAVIRVLAGTEIINIIGV